MSRGDLTEAEWRVLKELWPGKRGRGRPPQDNRNVINGILWRLRTGTPWPDVPEKYGDWNTIYRRFLRWSKSGVWESESARASGDSAEGTDQSPVRRCASRADRRRGPAAHDCGDPGSSPPRKVTIEAIACFPAACDVDVAVVGIAAETVVAPFQLLVQVFEHKIGEQRRGPPWGCPRLAR